MIHVLLFCILKLHSPLLPLYTLALQFSMLKSTPCPLILVLMKSIRPPDFALIRHGRCAWVEVGPTSPWLTSYFTPTWLFDSASSCVNAYPRHGTHAQNVLAPTVCLRCSSAAAARLPGASAVCRSCGPVCNRCARRSRSRMLAGLARPAARAVLLPAFLASLAVGGYAPLVEWDVGRDEPGSAESLGWRQRHALVDGQHAAAAQREVPQGALPPNVVCALGD